MDDFTSFSILVVDDEPLVLDVLSRQLSVIGFPVVLKAENGEVAVDLLSTSPVDLIICDWAMPKMNGMAVLKFIRSHPTLSRLPFIMYSGYVGEDIIAEAAETEVDAYMLKPFGIDELREKIRKVLSARKLGAPFERHLASGGAFRQAMLYEKAIPELEKAIELRPKSPRASVELGLCHEAQGDSTKSRNLFGKAIKLAPKYLKAHEAMAKQFFKEGNTDEYLKCLENMSDINPRNVDRNIVIGKTMAKCGRTEEAKKVLLETMEIASKQHSDIAEKIGEVFLDIGAPQLAEDIFSKALAVNPKSILSFNRLGIIHRQQGNYQKAIDIYQKGLEMAPNNENMMHNLAIAYFESGEKAKAIDMLYRVLEINPDLKEAQKLLDSFLSHEKK